MTKKDQCMTDLVRLGSVEQVLVMVQEPML